MRFLRKKDTLPEPTGRIINMMLTYWGHNFDVRRTEHDDAYEKTLA